MGYSSSHAFPMFLLLLLASAAAASAALVVLAFSVAGSAYIPAPPGSSDLARRLASSLGRRSPHSAPAAADQSSRAVLPPDAVTGENKKRERRAGESEIDRAAAAAAAAAVERELARARAAIRRAVYSSPAPSPSPSPPPPPPRRRGRRNPRRVHAEDVPLPNAYRNPAAFLQSYAEMEKRFKVYVYEEGEPPLVHRGPCKNIYTTEGRFIETLESMRPSASGVRTWDPRRAHAFFLPFSVAEMVEFVYRPRSYDHRPFQRFVADYVGVVASKHPFWNRTAGADHFMLSCHDWGPHASRGHPELYTNSIRALCNANTSEGFQPSKDVSIPEINLLTGDIPHQLLSPPPDLPARRFLAFFAGGLHGPIRPLLLHHWKGRDPDRLPVYEYLPKGLDYYNFMLHSYFCLCPSGHEVASPRIVEAIYAECVPVVISEGYALPFADVLRWEAFSVSVAVSDIPRLREVLEQIPAAEVERLREGVRAVKQHFVFNHPPKRFDVFNMILHSVWLRRLNVRLGH